MLTGKSNAADSDVPRNQRGPSRRIERMPLRGDSSFAPLATKYMKRLFHLSVALIVALIFGAGFAVAEEAVLVEFSISGKMGTKGELQNIFALEESLEKAIKSAGAGEFDGNEIGEGKCVLFMYGPNARKLFKAIEPIVRQSALTKGGIMRLRFGPPGSREEQVKL